MAEYILPIILLLVIVTGLIKRVDIYSSFTDAMRECMKLIIDIAPYIMAIMVMIELFEASGMNALLEKFLAPLLHIMGIPSELAPLIVIRPLSGNGSIAMLENILKTYGSDSYIGRCASIITGASETIFYVTALYFSTSHVKGLRYAIPVSLIASFVGVVVACLLARIM